MRSRIPGEQIDLLKTVPLFSSCTHGERREIAQLGTPIFAEEGAYLTSNGQPGRELFLVLEGMAPCRARRREVNRFPAGTYFGERAHLHGGIRTADVIAETPMELVVFDAREFRSLLMTTPSIGMEMLAHLAERVTETDPQYSS
jgi:CRP-like cAMP-binding protein